MEEKKSQWAKIKSHSDVSWLSKRSLGTLRSVSAEWPGWRCKRMSKKKATKLNEPSISSDHELVISICEGKFDEPKYVRVKAV